VDTYLEGFLKWAQEHLLSLLNRDYCCSPFQLVKIARRMIVGLKTERGGMSVLLPTPGGGSCLGLHSPKSIKFAELQASIRGVAI
jgi:hypothetical protein